MPNWTKITEDEGGEVLELQQEDDGTILLENLRNVFPDASTVKYKNNVDLDTWRIIRCIDDVLHPPDDDGWADHVYVIVVPKSSRMTADQDEEEDEEVQHNPNSTNNKSIYVLFDECNDLTEQDFRDYFGEFGTVAGVNGQISKGYVFITFDDEDVPPRLYGKPVTINSTELDIKEPENTDKDKRKIALLYKENRINAKDVRSYFEQYGEVTDVYITKPFKKYGFVTFRDSKTVKQFYDTSICINDVKVLCKKPRPKMAQEDKLEYGGSGPGGGMAGYGGYSGRGGGGYHGYAGGGGGAGYAGRGGMVSAGWGGGYPGQYGVAGGGGNSGYGGGYNNGAARQRRF